MFEDIEQMEKEIDAFRKNILASSALVEGIAALTEAAGRQEESFRTASDALIQQLESCVGRFRDDHADALKTLENENSNTAQRLRQSMESGLQTWLAAAEKTKDALNASEEAAARRADAQLAALKTEGEEIVSDMRAALAAEQNAFLARLTETENTLREYGAEAERRYTGFLKRMDETNVNQLLEEVQDLKKSLRLKFALLMTGVGAAVIAAVISIFLH